MSEELRAPEGFEVELLWVGAEEIPIMFVNHMVSQFQAGEFILTFGQQTPPIILGTTEQRREEAKTIRYIPIKAVARIGLTAQRMVDFVKVLQENLATYERLAKLERQGGESP